jgi:hypothetical protein
MSEFIALTVVPLTAEKFPLGQMVMTTNAASRLDPVAVHEGLRRHASGDWGDICPEDRNLNDEALEHGDRIVSVYGTGENRFWIITEWDRSVTTVLMPEDY